MRTHVRNILDALANQNRRTTEKIKEIEAAGGRIITSRPRGEDGWEIIDWRTGERLATSGQYRTHDAAITGIPGECWRIDQVWESIDRTGPTPPEGLPASLADVIEDWVNSAQTTDADLAAVAGVDAEDVEACRTDPLYDWAPGGTAEDERDRT